MYVLIELLFVYSLLIHFWSHVIHHCQWYYAMEIYELVVSIKKIIRCTCFDVHEIAVWIHNTINYQAEERNIGIYIIEYRSFTGVRPNSFSKVVFWELFLSFNFLGILVLTVAKWWFEFYLNPSTGRPPVLWKIVLFLSLKNHVKF